MSTPLSKRRRLNEASKTLHKPFKSPFRTPLKPTNTNTNPSESPSSDVVIDLVNGRDALSETPVGVSSAPAATNSRSNVSIQPPLLTPTSTPIRMHSPKPTATPKPRTRSSPALTRAITSLRSDIQILTQAHALATTNKDEKLLELIETWRTASRAVAEEVFVGTRERVQRMGGVGAWKDREREQKEWRKKWDEEDRKAESKGAEEDEEHEEMEGAGEEEEVDSKGNDDDSFTMDMMLRTLNIDLKLIGYDKDAQRWDG